MANNVAGPLYPTAAADGGGGSGTAWTGLTNIYTANNLSAGGDISGGGYHSSVLKATGYGFALPPTAQITGILVEVLRSGSAARDSMVQIIKGGSLAGTAKNPTSVMTNTLTYQSFGGDGDLWGLAVTPADINASNFGVGYQAQNTSGGGNVSVDTIRVTVYWRTTPTNVPKRYDYKVYSGGSFLGNLPQPKNEFSVSTQINTGGSQITVEVPVSADTSALPAGTGVLDETGAAVLDENGNPILSEGATNLLGIGTGSTLIKNGNQIVVIEYSYYWPNGHIAFLGRMERVEATFGGDAQDNSITVLCYSDGADLDNFLVYGSPFTYTQDQAQSTYNGNTTVSNNTGGVGDFAKVGQTFTVGTGFTNVGAVSYGLQGAADCTVKLWDAVNGNLLASATQHVDTAGASTAVQFTFANHIATTAGTVLFTTIEVASGQSILVLLQTSAPYAGGAVYAANYSGGSGGGAWTIQSGYDLCFFTFSTTGQTNATFTAQDPSTGILAGFMQDYRSRGGLLTTTPSSIQATGLSLTYQFNTNTIYEGIEAMLAVSPNGFYYYVDLPTDTLYFKQVSSTPDILLTKGVHINKLTFIATIENIYNLIFFTGGKDPAAPTQNIYRAYQDATSIALYGQKLQRLSDNHVIDTAVADAIGTSAKARNKDEQYQTTVTVLDRQMDISSLRVGMTVGIRGFGSFVDQLINQIVRIDYTPEAAILTLGVLPVQVNLAIEQINRDLIAQQTIANPATPS